MERDRHRVGCPSRSARRLLSLAAICTASTWWIAAGAAAVGTPPSNTALPAVSGSVVEGDVLTTTDGTWTAHPTAFAYVWTACTSPGVGCVAIAGATSSSYAPAASDVGKYLSVRVTASNAGGNASAASNSVGPVLAALSSQPTATGLLITPTTAVTNQSVTLIATVSATTSTGLSGTVTFEDGGAPIAGCTDMSMTSSAQSATVACSTSFAASTAQLSAVFTPTAGSTLTGSISPAQSFPVGPDSSSTSLDASTSVAVGSSTTYTATVAAPPSRPGPVDPTGSVEFLDAGQPIGSCGGQPLANGQATCTVAYSAVGAHQITARYSGDANFTGSSSGALAVSAVTLPANVLGTITSTMQWSFYYTPSFTMVRSLVVNGAPRGATVLVKCRGHGCPFAHRASLLIHRNGCDRKAGKMCFAHGTFNITPSLAGRRLAIGARLSVTIIRPNWIGKSYTFTVRRRRGPRIQIGCLAPGGTVPGVGC